MMFVEPQITERSRQKFHSRFVSAPLRLGSRINSSFANEMSAAWFGVADNAGDGGKPPPQTAFSGIDQSVHCTDRQGGIDLAMEINDLPICRFANADIMHLAQTGDFGGKRGQ